MTTWPCPYCGRSIDTAQAEAVAQLARRTDLGPDDLPCGHLYLIVNNDVESET